jgi:hypothetical protein
MIIILHFGHQNLCTEPLTYYNSGFERRVKMNLNYIYSTRFTVNSSAKFHGSLIDIFGGEICGETGKGTERISP